MGRTKLYLSGEFREAWKGSDAFEKVGKIEGEVYRALENRKTVKFSFAGESYFIKIHRTVSWREILKNLVQLRLPVVSAENEWVALGRLQELNIDTLSAVAYGKRGLLPSRLESFLITRDLGDTESLESLCAKWKAEPPAFAFKKALIEKVADYSQRLHRNGICHRDFYICHFLLSSQDPGRLYVIDLHRALVKKNLKQRWIIKDIGALYFSSMEIGLTRHDLFRFIRLYSGKSLRCTLHEDALFWKSVSRKAQSLKNR